MPRTHDTQDGLALQHSLELSGDREVALAAVGQNGMALQHVSEQLRGDREACPPRHCLIQNLTKIF